MIEGKVAYDESDTRPRSRLHQQQVADILNSMIESGQLQKVNGGWVFVSALSDLLAQYVPTARTLTINGVTFDLAANRSWTISTSGGLVVTAKTADYTASASDIVSCDATSASFTVTLPSSPTASQVVGVKLETTASSHTVTVARNGSTIDGAASNLTLAIAGDYVELVCIGTNAWAIKVPGIGSGTGNIARVTSPTFVTPLLGTPASGTLTNCTGYPAASLAGATLAAGVASSSLSAVGTIVTGVWHGTALSSTYGGLGGDNSASTGIPLFTAGVTSILGFSGTGNVVRVTSAALVTPDLGTPSAGTLSSCIGLPKPRVTTATSAATLTANYDTQDQTQLTAQAASLVIGPPSGTPSNGQKIIIRVKDDGTSRSVTFDSAFRAVGVTLPSATTISKTMYLGCIYNSAASKTDVVAVAQEA